jgi:hypothetical protein
MDYELSKIGDKFDHLDNFNLYVILKNEDFTIKDVKKINPVNSFSHLNF